MPSGLSLGAGYDGLALTDTLADDRVYTAWSGRRRPPLSPMSPRASALMRSSVIDWAMRSAWSGSATATAPAMRAKGPCLDALVVIDWAMASASAASRAARSGSEVLAARASGNAGPGRRQGRQRQHQRPGRLGLDKPDLVVFAASFGRKPYGAAAAAHGTPVTGRLRSPPYPAAAPVSSMARPSTSRRVRQSPEECHSRRAGTPRIVRPGPPTSTVLRIPLRGTRPRRAVDPGASASPAGLTARARPKARPKGARRASHCSWSI